MVVLNCTQNHECPFSPRFYFRYIGSTGSTPTLHSVEQISTGKKKGFQNVKKVGCLTALTLFTSVSPPFLDSSLETRSFTDKYPDSNVFHVMKPGFGDGVFVLRFADT